MIICKTPFRVSFFGGGSDFPDWFEKNRGEVLSTAIDKYCYVMFRSLPQIHTFKSRIVYNQIEMINSNHLIKHPSINPILKYYKINTGVEIVYCADLPSQTGLGTSSAFTVALINSIYKYKNIHKSKKIVATEAIKLEQDILKENVGCQDQVVAAYGGFNRISFYKGKKFKVKKIKISNKTKDKLENNLHIFYTGVSRLSGKIEKDKIKHLSQKNIELKKITSFVKSGIEILEGNPKYLSDFGSLLDEAWFYKKKLSNFVSNNYLDSIYDLAKSCGAKGGKLLGAGGGGFFLFYCNQKVKNKILLKSPKLKSFKLNFVDEGSKILLNN